MAVVNRLLALLLGLALLAAGAVLVVETVAATTGTQVLPIDRGALDSRLSDLQWTDFPVDVTIGVLLGLGALFLLLQLVPRPPDSLPPAAVNGREAEIERKSVATVLAQRASDDPEVLRAKAKIKRRAAHVSAKAQPGADTRTVRDRLVEMVDDTLQPLQLRRRLRPRVSVQRSRERTS
jgi:hypothetical protein